ncbi:type III-A CRISPR-associated RAMP protein Csm4 [Methylococcus sp. Mc7]|uniref:type III-A CRISPR-associated RAMP protein Csm4 n=1 Tax=Methylococcus sp. Mc7 TaxID=2860258 RepID=UPI001C52D20D|nr:type III-A CRISPR-associated RAMP protein Csm4 [Methylococcus sp. Mc7]QXP83827.1 type III-A CRISPR-associated RAMP protein Csm4 [Methylococcus sp. Mc7]
MFCYRLRFQAPFHVDSRGNDSYEQAETFIRSDTLSAAILSAWALLDPDGVAERAKAPSFRLSSAFPFLGDICFLPRPVDSLAVSLDPVRLRDNKKLKKIQWLSVGLWKAVAGGFRLDDAEAINILGTLATLKTETLADEKLWVVEERPRLAMDRLTNSHAEELLFHFSRVWLNPMAGLYFLATFDDGQAQTDFEAALRLLGDEGFGADRSNGNGCFTFDHRADLGLKPPAGRRAMALSLVNPDPSDRRQGWLDEAAYKLVSRGGWIAGTGLRKQRLRMFAEGSVFQAPLQGRTVEISPDHAPHPVYRDGRGLFVALEG